MVDNLLGDDFPFAEDILEGVDAFVCGASKGIGRSCALMLARSGAKVTVCSRSKDNLEKLIGEMYGSGHDYLVIDLEKLDEVRSELKDLRKYNILINNYSHATMPLLFQYSNIKKFWCHRIRG